jgi:hypothetical protein
MLSRHAPVPARAKASLAAAALALILLIFGVSPAAPASPEAGSEASPAKPAAKGKKKGVVRRACGRYSRLHRMHRNRTRRIRRARGARRARAVVLRRTARRLTRAKRVCRRARRVARQARHRRKRHLALGPTARGTGSAAQQPAPGAAFRWGVVANTKGRGPGMAAEQDRIKELGVGWLREEFGAAPGQDSDAVFLEAARRGLRVLPLVQISSTPPSNPDAYADMVAAFARRYGPGGDFWAAHPELDGGLAATHIEIYNEPYGDWYGPVDPAAYARALKAAVTRARAANPQAKFLIAADWTPGGQRHTWIDDLYAAVPELNGYFDAVAMHPYSGNRAPDRSDDPWGFRRIAQARAAFQRHGAGDKPFWITEIGWSTCPSDPEWCVSEAQQADYMLRAAWLVRSEYRFVEAMFFYHYRLDEAEPSNSEHFLGLVHDDFTPKPAWHAVRRITGIAG